MREICRQVSSVTDIEKADVMDVECDNMNKLHIQCRQSALSAASDLKETKDTMREAQR